MLVVITKIEPGDPFINILVAFSSFLDRYFSTLEQLVTASEEDGHASYYPHGVTYRAAGYTFLEEFLDCLDSELLGNILA